MVDGFDRQLSTPPMSAKRNKPPNRKATVSDFELLNADVLYKAVTLALGFRNGCT